MTTRITSFAADVNRVPTNAGKVMTPNPTSINRHATVRETAMILHEHGLQIAPVIDDAGRPIGVVSRSDLLDYWGRRRDRLTALAIGELNAAPAPGAEEPGDELTVPQIMTPVVLGVRMNAPIASIVEKMIALEIRCLFVTDGDGVLVGTISVFDVLRHLLRGNLPATPKRVTRPSFSSTKFSLGCAMPP